MAIAFDAVTSAQADPGVDPLNYSHTNNGDFLVVGVTHNGARNTLGATYNSVALTQLIILDTGIRHASLWYLVNPDIGSHIVSVDFSGSAVCSSGTISLTGVDTMDPIGDSDSVQVAGTNPFVDLVTTREDSLLIDCLHTFIDDPTVGPNQTERWEENYSNQRGHGSTRITTVPATYRMEWTLPVSRTAALVAAEIKAKVAGGKLANIGDLNSGIKLASIGKLNT